MANVKSRLKAQSSARKGCGAKSNTVNNSVKSVPVMKSTSVKPVEDKVQYTVPNNGVISEELSKRRSNTKSREKKKTFHSLVTKSGRIKKKDKEKLRLLDNILKSELLISDTDKKLTANKKKNVNNNNSIGIDDHNKTDNLPKKVDDQIKSTYVFSEGCKKKNSPKKPSSYSRAIQTSPNVDTEPVEFICDHCNKTFETKTEIEKHIYGHLNLKPHQCPHCPKKFHYRINMQVHIMKLHNISDEYIETCMCSICGKVFLGQESLNSHLSTHHSKKASFFKCIYCEKKFSESSQLLEHEKQHLVTGRYECPTCGYSYGIRDHFEAHLKSHIKIKDFVCQHCGKEFLRLNSMQRHVLVCHAGHRIQCPICKKKLKGHLTEHLRTHDKKRPHECPECGQCFTQSTQLTVHRRSHTGARPYPCKICSRSFSHSTALMLHIRRHTGEKPFRCAMCPLMFSQLPHMKAHMRTIHGKENAYKCKKCAQFFKLKVDLERHVKTCTVITEPEISSDGKIRSPDETEEDSAMSLSRMRYLLALLLTIISTKDKLKYLGFNKRLIDELLIECLQAMCLRVCMDETLSPLRRLKRNIDTLLAGTVPKEQMDKFKSENKTTEELLELLTNEKKNE